MKSQQSSPHPLKRIALQVLIVAPVLGGCASIPDVSVSYRPVKWALLVTVAHTITCNKDSTLAIVERGATFTPIYSAASADTRYEIRMKDLDRYYADADITVSLMDDGRLKSINQSTTGQGEAIVKSAIAAAATVTAIPSAAPLAVQPPPGVSFFNQNVFKEKSERASAAAVCGIVRNRSVVARDQLAQVSLVQIALVKPDSGPIVDAKPSKDQEALLQELKAAALDLTAKVSTALATDELQPIARPKDTVANNEVPLILQRMVNLSATATDAQGTIGSKSVPVPTTATFSVPIPKAA